MDPRFRPARAPSYDPPSPAGFWIQDLPDPISGELQVIRNRSYEVQTYQRALFPLTAGTFTIPPARLIFDMRGGVFFGSETREVMSDSLQVTVRPLPDAGKPAAFRGAVGSFTVTGELNRSTAGERDAVTYTMRVEGTGNIKSLPPPPFPAVPNVDVYPPSEDAALRIVNGVIGGVRTFQWVLIPRRAGDIVVPAVEYAWFDPAVEQYRTASTSPLQLAVTPASAVAATPGDTTLAPLRTTGGSHLGTVVQRPWFLLLQLVPLGALGVLLFLRRRPAHAADARSRRSALNTRIRELEPLARTDPRAFYATAIVIVADIRALSTDASIQSRCEDIALRLRSAMYAPAQPDDAARATDVAFIRSLLDDVAQAGSANSSVGVALLLCGALAAGASARQGTPFQAGITQYVQGDYAGAATAFRQHVQQTPLDATGWYDLGNAHYHAGDAGRAVWAWLHARELEPRGRDIAHNLGLLDASRAEATVQHWFPISTAELTVLAAACWWLALLCAGVYVVRRRAGARVAGLLFATACATALIMLGARIAGPGTVVPAGQGAPLFAGPTARTDRRGTLEVGDAASIIRREGEWLLVRTTDYREGWVRTASVADL